MYGSELSNFSGWWIIPILMMVFCFLMMKRRKGFTMCGFGAREAKSDKTNLIDSAMEILNRRYALGETDKDEYEEKKLTLNQS